MPYENEIASGDSLIWLENSQALKDFEGVILRKQSDTPVEPPIIQAHRRDWFPRRVIAIDGSNLMHRVNNGYPGAEAGLVMTSVVAIKLDQLKGLVPSSIPRPSFFRDIENALTLEAAMPGIGVVRKGVDNDTPIDFFRQKTYDTLSNEIASGHETLLETLRSMCGDLKTRIDCPADACNERYERKEGEYACHCDRREKMFETDMLRLHEYFDGVRSGGEALGRLRSVLEILILLNILRFFVEKCPEYLNGCAFVLDGPLAIFGAPASILRPIREELIRLNDEARKVNGTDIVVFGIEKSGRFKEHWEQLDWKEGVGPGSRFPAQTVAVPNDEYIHKNIIPADKKGKPFGEDTHFGRVVLYKTNKGGHIVLHTAMLNKAANDFGNNSPECYPRLGDILDVIDKLAILIYDGGFMPVVRAHAHAAIPLKRGTDIIKNLLQD